VKKSAEPLTLVVLADKAVSYEKCLRLALLAREAGISDALLATLPRAYAAPAVAFRAMTSALVESRSWSQPALVGHGRAGIFGVQLALIFWLGDDLAD
jgi:hypothetical protein